MSTKLNSFILTDDIIRKMKTKVEESRHIDKEIGFNLCTDNHNLHDENPCIGNECDVDIPKGCKKGDFVGLFHTHPHTSSKPSIQDIANAYQIGINCIGSTEETDIKCYIRKDKTYRREGLENIIAALIRYESPLHISNSQEKDIENYEEYIDIRNNLIRQYLNKVNVI